MRLNGNVAAVTGSGKGIGRSIALRLAREGANVIVTDVDLALAEETASAISELGQNAHALAVDVTHRRQVEQISTVAEEVFDSPIEIMVNNAGIQQLKEVLELTREDWDRVLNVNARGTLFGMQMAAKAMKEQGRGTIINMASIMGRIGHPLYAHYAASKAAIISLTKSFALALAPYGVRVNSVGPGIVDTDLWDLMDTQWAELEGLRKGEPKAQRIGQVPLGRAGTPEDVANTVAFLATDEAAYITGECIHISGGSLML
jgi:meso-butanediol dehydrogenase / (S,S)-butanediol dehydrogenase / diacetyl reductase